MTGQVFISQQVEALTAAKQSRKDYIIFLNSEAVLELRQLRAFLAVAETLHFGHAAHAMGVLPAVLGRQVQMLEKELRVRLFTRTTRHVDMTDAGRKLLPRARALVSEAADIVESLHKLASKNPKLVRIGAIDSAASGLIPSLLKDLHLSNPELEIILVEDKTVRLIPQLLSGMLDIAFGRPPERMDARIRCEPLLEEKPVLALPLSHPLVDAERITIERLSDFPLILPSRRSRPHSYNLAVKLFEKAGLPMNIAMEAEEKQTILSMVAAGIGAAIVPRWSATTGSKGVEFRALADPDPATLPLSAMWLDGVRHTPVEEVLRIVRANLATYRASA